MNNNIYNSRFSVILLLLMIVLSSPYLYAQIGSSFDDVRIPINPAEVHRIVIDMEEEIARMKDQVGEKDRVIALLKKKNASNNPGGSMHDYLNRTIKMYEKEKIALEKKIVFLSDCLSEKEAFIVKLNDQNSNLAKENAKLNGELSQLKADYNNLSLQNDALIRENEKLVGLNEKQRKEIELMKEKIGKLNKEIAELKNELDYFRRQEMFNRFLLSCDLFGDSSSPTPRGPGNYYFLKRKRDEVIYGKGLSVNDIHFRMDCNELMQYGIDLVGDKVLCFFLSEEMTKREFGTHRRIQGNIPIVPIHNNNQYLSSIQSCNAGGINKKLFSLKFEQENGADIIWAERINGNVLIYEYEISYTAMWVDRQALDQTGGDLSLIRELYNKGKDIRTLSQGTITIYPIPADKMLILRMRTNKR